MTARIAIRSSAGNIPLDLAPIPIGGCRSVIGPFPRLLLMKDNVLLMVYIVPLREYTVKSFLLFLRIFLSHVIMNLLIGGLYTRIVSGWIRCRSSHCPEVLQVRIFAGRRKGSQVCCGFLSGFFCAHSFEVIKYAV